MSEQGDNSLPSVTPQESNTVPFTYEDNNKGDDDIGVDIFENSRKRKHTSDVWNHFRRLMVEQIQYAGCNYCKTRLKTPSSHGTTHLKKHYGKTCKKRLRKMDIRQSLLAANKKSSANQELTTHIFNQDESRHKLAFIVILHDYSLSIVDNLEFRRFVASLQPCFNMISRNTLRSDILKIYNIERKKCYKLLDKLHSCIAITTDMWTSNNAKKCFMAIIGHYIDDSWTLQYCILRFIYVPALHTIEVLSEVLVEFFIDWNIDRKLSTITVDNCSTNDAILNLLLGKVSRTDMLLNGKVLHIHCCAHILNLIMKDGLQVISGAIERIRDSVLFWTASPARVKNFEEAARQLHVNCSKKLSLDCKTCWNSTYLMLESAIVYKDIFPRVKYRDRFYKTLPTAEDWVNAVEICGKLKIFYQVTEMFSGTLYPTSNFYFPTICDIKLKLDEWVKSSNLMIQCMVEKMLEKYEKYWDVCHIMMGLAAILDPRYKLKLVEFYFQLIYGERSYFKVEEIRQNYYDLLIDYYSRAATSKENSFNSGLGYVEGTSSSCVFSVVDMFDSDTLEMYDKFVALSSNPYYFDVLNFGVGYIFGRSVLPRAQNFDILSWWKTNGVKYPNLQKMAKDLLAIPVSTVASESVFSSSGRMISPHRSRLYADTLEALMCTCRWLWNDVKGVCSTVGGISTCPTMLDEEEDEEECITEILPS